MVREATSVVIVDDHAMVRDGLAALLGAEPDIDVIALAGSVAEATRAIESEPPDVLVTDYQLPDGTGLDLAELVQSRQWSTHVLVISGLDRPSLIEEAVRAGCSGFLSKGRDTSELVEAVRSVVEGTAVFPAAALLRLVRVERRQVGSDLTDRELEVLRLLARPMSVNEIADELVVSIHTARNHVRSVLTKLDARSQLEAVVVAVRHGVIDIA